MEKQRVLLIEDKEQERRMASTALEKQGYEVIEADSGEKGLGILDEVQPHLVLLDIMLPGMDGLDVCRQIRTKMDVPIIMITGKAEEVDKVVGLELGADDYVTKPYSIKELIARVRAMLRRTGRLDRLSACRQSISYPGLEIDVPTRTVTCQNETVHLTPKEFDLLFHLAAHPRQVFNREDIVEQVWGYGARSGDLRTVDTHVKRLRKKLEEGRDVPWTLATVWGIGYKFELDE